MTTISITVDRTSMGMADDSNGPHMQRVDIPATADTTDLVVAVLESYRDAGRLGSTHLWTLSHKGAALALLTASSPAVQGEASVTIHPLAHGDVAFEAVQPTHAVADGDSVLFAGSLANEELVGRTQTRSLAALAERGSVLARHLFERRLGFVRDTNLDPRRAALRAETNRILGNEAAAEADDREVEAMVGPLLATLHATPHEQWSSVLPDHMRKLMERPQLLSEQSAVTKRAHFARWMLQPDLTDAEWDSVG